LDIIFHKAAAAKSGGSDLWLQTISLLIPFLGLKFKLVKSNSCSSRLELAGTGLERSYLESKAEEMRNIIHGSDLQQQQHEEETVKDMIYRLEGRQPSSAAAASSQKPRIIESRCIEKPQKLTINNQTTTTSGTTKSIISDTISEKDVNLQTVTVNNHISVVASNDEHANENHDVPMPPPLPTINDELPQQILQSDSGNESGNGRMSKPKVVRNKNVDLALASLVERRNENNARLNAMTVEHLARKGASATTKESNKWGNNICKMESVEMVKSHQDKINNCAHIRDVSAQKQAPTAMSVADEKQPIKMVNWSTVGNLGKEYIANDRRLIETKAYDEIEFEEFEVMGSEHYDSLNSK